MSAKFESTSASLLGRAKNQDQDAWSQLVDLYGPLVHRWCRQSGLSEEDTADVFQETFRVVARKLDTFQPQKSIASFRSWLKTIVRTKTIDHLRRRQRNPRPTGGTEAQMQFSQLIAPAADDSVEESAADDALIVRRAMELIRPEFDPRNWNAFLEVAIQGKPATEVARRLNVKAQTIRQANYRIRRRLRVILQDLVEDP